MGFSRQEYWSGLLCCPRGHLPNPGIKPESCMSPALAGGFFTWGAPKWDDVFFVQLPIYVRIFATPWTVAYQTSLSLTVSQSLPKFMFIASVMLSSHLIPWCPLLLCPQPFPASGTFPVSQLFALDDPNTGASVSASVLSVNILGWSPVNIQGWLVWSPCWWVCLKWQIFPKSLNLFLYIKPRQVCLLTVSHLFVCVSTNQPNKMLLIEPFLTLRLQHQMQNPFQ